MYKLFLILLISSFSVNAGSIALRAKAEFERRAREAADRATAEAERLAAVGNAVEAEAARSRAEAAHAQASNAANNLSGEFRTIAAGEQARAFTAVQRAEAAITAANFRSTPLTNGINNGDIGSPPVVSSSISSPSTISTSATITTTEANSTTASQRGPSTPSLPISSDPSFQSIISNMGSLTASLRHRLGRADTAEPATAGPGTSSTGAVLTVTSSDDPQIDALIQRVDPATGNRLRVVMDWVRRQEKEECFMMESSTLQTIIQKAMAAQDIPGEVLEARLKGYNLLNIHGQLDDILPPSSTAPAFTLSAVSVGGASGSSSGSTDDTTVSSVPHLLRGSTVPGFEEDPTQ